MNLDIKHSPPIRILHVVTYMGRGGLETMIMNYYRHIDRNLVQFDFLVHREFRADYDDEIEKLGGRIFRISRLVPWGIRYRRELHAFFDKHPEYRIVHVHQDCLSSIILEVARKHHIPIRIGHSHNSSQDKNLKYLIKLFYKRRIPQTATHLFACGKEAGDWMFDGAAYRIMNNAIDTRQYLFHPQRRTQIRRQLNIASDCFVIGHIGRFHPQKNHDFLLDIFAKFQKDYPDSLLLLVGDGDLRSQMEQKACTLGIAGKVLFTGVRSDVPDMLQAMDCFVFPSLYEGIPVTMIEAQAAGLSCLVSTGVPKECAKTELVQFLALSDGAQAWVDHIRKYKDVPRPNTFSQIASAGYDIEANSHWLQEFYLEHWKKEK